MVSEECTQRGMCDRQRIHSVAIPAIQPTATTNALYCHFRTAKKAPQVSCAVYVSRYAYSNSARRCNECSGGDTLTTQMLVLVLVLLALSFGVAFWMGWVDQMLPPDGKFRQRLRHINLGTVSESVGVQKIAPLSSSPPTFHRQYLPTPLITHGYCDCSPGTSALEQLGCPWQHPTDPRRSVPRVCANRSRRHPLHCCALTLSVHIRHALISRNRSTAFPSPHLDRRGRSFAGCRTSPS